MSSEAVLDRRFVALAGLLRSATKSDPSARDVGGFADALLQAAPTLFAGTLIFRSREGGRFVLIQQAGEERDPPRSWLRWPLRRLFAVRRSSIVTNPRSLHRALAVPFMVSGERYVVVATLRSEPVDSTDGAFLDALQSVPTALPQISSTYGTSRFVWFGSDESLAARVEAVCAQRGWDIHRVPTFGHLLMLLESDLVDVAAVQASTLAEPLHALRALRHAAKIGDAPVLYFTDADPGAEIGTLVDAWLPSNASDGELLKALKRAASLISPTRKRALVQRARKMEQELRACTDECELARACARAALTLGAEAASVMLVDEIGSTCAAHEPVDDETLLDRWPNTFLTGEPVTQSILNDRFFVEVFDDDEYAQRIRSQGPVSGSALPIRDASRTVGTLLAFSRTREMFEPEFTALKVLCRVTATAYAMLNGSRRQGSPGGALAQRWRRVALGDARIDVYEGTRGAALGVRASRTLAAIAAVEDEDPARAALHVRSALQEIAALGQQDVNEQLDVLLEKFDDGNRGVLLGVLDAEGGFTFACARFPAPLIVHASGPVRSIRPASTRESGRVLVDPGAVTLVYSNEFAAQIETAEFVSHVQHNLRIGAANAVQTVPDLASSSGKLAFASITMRTYAADSRRSQALI